MPGGIVTGQWHHATHTSDIEIVAPFTSHREIRTSSNKFDNLSETGKRSKSAHFQGRARTALRHREAMRAPAVTFHWDKSA